MSIRTTIGTLGLLSKEASIEEGTPNEVVAKKAARVSEWRLLAARKNTTHWTEVKETDFIPRGRWLVHVDSDELYTVYRGTIFGPGSASIDFNAHIEMSWYVDQNDGLVFLEKVRSPRTWSEVVKKKAMRG